MKNLIPACCSSLWHRHSCLCGLHRLHGPKAGVALLLLLSTGIAAAQSLADLKSTNLLLDVDLTVNTAAAHFQGSDSARLTLVEFFDLECPNTADYCDRAFPQVIDAYVKTGKLRYLALDFPIEKFHSNALKAATLAQCAGEQGRFWEARPRLLSNPVILDTAALGLDRSRFQECMESGRGAAKVKTGLEEGRKLKMPGTPSFYLGYRDPADQSKVHAIKLLIGTQPFGVFQDLIDSLLKVP